MTENAVIKHLKMILEEATEDEHSVCYVTSCDKEPLEMAIKTLEVVNKITDIIKIEQQPTSCEHTKLKSFAMIEEIITNYQLENCK